MQMESTFDKLVSRLTLSTSSNDTLHQITLILQQQQQQSTSLSAFVADSFAALFTLQQWTWQLFAQHSQQHLQQTYHAQLLHTLASFNRTLVYHYDHIDLDTKVALIVPQTIEQIDRIFQLVDQCADDNDPLIGVISLWLENHAHFLHENPSYDQSPVLYHISHFIVTHYLMSDQYKAYLAQLRQSPLSESVLSARMVFYMRTCSFYMSSNLGVQFHRYSCSAEEILRRLCDDYLEIIHVHSYTVSSWSKALLGCIGHFAGLILDCFCWSVDKQMLMKILLPTEAITCQHMEDLIRIIAYTPFYKELLEVEMNDETLLLDTVLMALIVILKTQNVHWFLRSNLTAQNVLLAVATGSVNEKISLRAHAILSSVLTNEQLKELRIADGMAKFFFHMLELGWKDPSKSYRQIPIVYLLKGLRNLAKSDSMQQTTADLNKTSLLIDMCDQYPIVYDILWALSFNLDIQQQLRSSSLFMSKLAQLANDSNDEQMRKITHGILWNLESKHPDHHSTDALLVATTEPQPTFDIMISYSHKDKVLCEQLYEHLVHAGFRVWIDFDQMHGNVMDAMAQAIERSQMIIICMSEQYRRSNYCRAEAHYAFQRQLKLVPVLLQKHYKPDGWLLFLIGQLLYVDFTKHEFDRAIEMLMKEIKTPNAGEVVSGSLALSKPVAGLTIMQWTEEEMRAWLVEHRLPKMGRLLQGCDGRSVAYLHRYLEQVPAVEMLRLLEEDSRLKTKESVSVTELCRFQSLMDQERLQEELPINNVKKGS